MSKIVIFTLILSVLDWVVTTSASFWFPLKQVKINNDDSSKMIKRDSIDQGNFMLQSAIKLTTSQNPFFRQNSDSYASVGMKGRPTRTSFQTDHFVENFSEDNDIIHVTSEHRVLKRKGDSGLYRRQRRRITLALFARGQAPIATSKPKIKPGSLRQSTAYCNSGKFICVTVDLSPIKNKKP